MAQGLFTLRQVNQGINTGAWPAAPAWVEYLCVAGGGGAGAVSNGESGGGGGGGLLTGIVPVAAGSSYTVTVGGGGAGGTSNASGVNGSNSVFGSITSSGGGGGARYGYEYGTSGGAKDGGSGGGGSQSGDQIPAQGIPGQGNAGGVENKAYPNSCGGGGGAGTIGGNGIGNVGGNGGQGLASDISGVRTVYAGGGGGSSQNNGIGSLGGAGGGGASHGSDRTSGVAGTTNTGGGAGGGGDSVGTVAAGGSGIVIVRYAGYVKYYTGGTVNYSNGYISHTFTSTGTLAPTTPVLYDITDTYQISRSLRFKSASTTYLNRTPSTTTNRRTFTYSGWVKLSTTGEYPFLMAAGTGGQIWLQGDAIRVRLSGSPVDYYYDTTAFFRDCSAWYHIVVGVDTTTSVSQDRVKIYVNGTRQIIGTISAVVPQNFDTDFNLSATAHQIGNWPGGAGYTPNAYMTEINFIDGIDLNPSAFAHTNANTGQWVPHAYVGSYGTNGFCLKFSDNSNTTAATLGADSSGNGNNWTPNNFSVTAGAGNDSLVDSPTMYGTDTGVGGEVRGNYCTWNPLLKMYVQPTLSSGNLVSVSGGDWSSAVGTFGLTSGKWYWEIVNTMPDAFVGICGDNAPLGTTYPQSCTGTIWYYGNSGGKRIDSVEVAYGSTFTTQTIGVALDIDGGTICFYKNNVSQGNISLSSSTLNGRTIFPAVGSASTTVTANFGQRAFAYTAPSGFKALCTQNLPTPTIGATTATQASKYFNAITYTGQTADLSIDVGFKPDLVLIRSRANAVDLQMFDTVRGANISLQPNTAAAEGNYSTLPSFNSNGYTVSNNSLARDGTNYPNYTYVSWNWRASNATAVSNTSGSITSSVSANTTAGFSIVTYTGTGAAATIGHGLGVAPSMIMTKSRSNNTGDGFTIYHKSLTSANYWVDLKTSSAIAGPNSVVWNNTAPTSSVFSVGGASGTSQNTYTYVAYCFAAIAGYSAFGSYTGNGSSDGTFVNTGFRPAFILIKKTNTNASGGGNWWVMDNKRPGNYNPIATTGLAYINLTNAEGGSGNWADFYSNGFKLRMPYGDGNGSDGEYIYAAFAESPFKYANAR